MERTPRWRQNDVLRMLRTNATRSGDKIGNAGRAENQENLLRQPLPGVQSKGARWRFGDLAKATALPRSLAISPPYTATPERSSSSAMMMRRTSLVPAPISISLHAR